MRIGLPFDPLHDAIASAIHCDFPEITYEDRDWEIWRTLSKEEQTDAIQNRTVPMLTKSRRVYSDEIEVTMFPQTWGSTATGYGGMGGAAITSAYTIIVCYKMTTYCVYFGCGRLAYKLNWADMSPAGREKFMSDISARSMAAVAQSGKYR
jgi:predicted Fe-S protein YdhL (DUF1289 family)